uniref:Integrin-alpha FG-GAP repeat-containing protein 2 n=1 Tax=Schistosoma mansoni TaxID=6183 RepID=A0A5K4FAY0_SCHMA
MRSLSLVDRVFFKDIYTSDSCNLCLYDVDNDGDNELIIGSWDSGPLLENGEANAANSEGSVHVLKYRKVWKASYHLGMVSCVTAGSIYKPDETWIIALCSDSHCYAFDACGLVPESENISSKSKQKINAHGSSKADQTVKTEVDTLKMVHHQELAYNAKDVCIFKEGEIAVAHSDRVVRLYSWCSFKTTDDKSKILSNKISNLGEFILLIKWELAGQVNRIDTCLTQEYGLILIASQPSGGFAHLHRKFEKYHDMVAPTLTYYPPRISNSNNLETRTWLIGNVNHSNDTNTIIDSKKISRLLCLCTADGHMRLVDPTIHNNSNDNDESIIWSIQVHTRSELFALCKMKLTKDDGDQLVVCSWDGTTYIFDINNNSLCFPLGRSCQAFIAGLYAIEPGRNSPVLIYSTFDRNTLIYYNLCLNNIAVHSLHNIILNDYGLVKKFQSKNVDPYDSVQLSKAIHYILYDLPKQETHPLQ